MIKTMYELILRELGVFISRFGGWGVRYQIEIVLMGGLGDPCIYLLFIGNWIL